MIHTMTHSPMVASLHDEIIESISKLKIMALTFLPPLLLLMILALISFRATIGLSINKNMLFNLDKIAFKLISATFHHALSMCSVRGVRRPHQCRQWANEIYPGSFMSPIDRQTMLCCFCFISPWNTTPRCRTANKLSGNPQVSNIKLFVSFQM